jgi:hypothetical protein
MRIDAGSSSDLASRIGDDTGDVQSQVNISVLKETMDNAETNTMELLQSLQPHLGQNVDVRL